MGDTRKDIVIFTGQSGIKVENCIKKLADDGLGAQPISIDKQITKSPGAGDFVDVLGKPPRIQESLWSGCFSEAVRNLPKSVDDGKYIFITFHACYFHQRKTDFTSPVNFAQLPQIQARTKMVIVLIILFCFRLNLLP